MTSHEGSQQPLSAEDQLLDLLPLVAENFTPQLGYRFELTSIALSNLPLATDSKAAFANLAGHAIQDDATFVYTYNVLDDTVDIESIKLALETRIEYEGKIAADSVYLQRYHDGFVSSLGLRDQTIADIPQWPMALPEASVKSLLHPVGLYSIGGGDIQARTADILSQAKHWAAREQQMIPLPTEDPDWQHQMIVARKRGVIPVPGKERPLYSEDYEVVFQTISQHNSDEHMRHVSEVTLLTRNNDVNERTFSLIETEYDRYDHPFVIGLPEASHIQETSQEPTQSDIAAYVKLLQDFAA
jgi:hypothetical protein